MYGNNKQTTHDQLCRLRLYMITNNCFNLVSLIQLINMSTKIVQLWSSNWTSDQKLYDYFLIEEND